jgi:UDP-glucose 4-epimerase
LNNVIITGADGFIGSKLSIYFANKGKTVYALVHKTNNFSDYENIIEIPFELDNIECIQGKLPMNADALIHLAWSGVSSDKKNDYEIQFPNVKYSLEVLKLAHKLLTKKVIFTGSVSEYAYCGEVVTGNNIPSPSDYYSAAKVATHYTCDLYARQNDIHFNWLLISSIYGPGRNDNNLITYAIKSLLNGDVPSFTKLEQKWDYIYIDDLISAIYHIYLNGKKGRVYPIGSGHENSLYEYVTIIKNLINPSLKLGVGELPYKTKRIDNSLVDITSLKEDTGFEPLCTFEYGIKKTINYFSNL